MILMKIMKKVNDIKQANGAASEAGAAGDSRAHDAAAAARRYSHEKSMGSKLFMSYPRGELTTPFTRWLKGKLESEGYSVWMDEEGIQGGVDYAQLRRRGVPIEALCHNTHPRPTQGL